jgi:hypothetical protein
MLESVSSNNGRISGAPNFKAPSTSRLRMFASRPSAKPTPVTQRSRRGNIEKKA